MNARDRRALLLGGCVVLAAWTGLRAAPRGLRFVSEREATVAQKGDLVARSREQVGRLSEMGDSIEALTRIVGTLDGWLLVGGNQETAAVDLMRRVRGALAARSVSFLAFERRREDLQAGPLSLAGVTVRIETDFRQLLELLDGLESDTTLAVERLEIIASEADSSAEMERLVAEVAVSGWYQRDGVEGR